MKSLSLSRPVAILMVGAPGSGKSFFARQFAEMFSAPLVSFDAIRTELFKESSFTPDEERIISRIAAQMSEQLFKTHRSFIIDGGMNSRTSRYDVSRLAKMHGYDTLVVWVQIDERSSQARAQKRISNRDTDKFNQSLTPEQYQRLVKAFTPPSARDNVLVISGKHTFSTQARMMLKRLAPAREQANPHTSTPPVAPAPSTRQNPQASPSTRRLTIQ